MFRKYPRGSRIAGDRLGGTRDASSLSRASEIRQAAAVDAVSTAREMLAENDGEHRSEWIV
jgi:hypothetical protein